MTARQREYIEKLYLERYEWLKSYALSSLKNEDLAHEAVQEVFRIACQKANQVCGSECPEGWLFLTLKNIIANSLRARKRCMDLQRKLQLINPGMIQDPMPLHLMCSNISDTEEFKLLYEFAVEERTVEELARRRGISVNACKKRIQRAKAFLARKIRKK